jgi:hypothetical protein
MKNLIPFLTLILFSFSFETLAQVDTKHAPAIPKKFDKKIAGADKSNIYLNRYELHFYVQSQASLGVGSNLRVEIDIDEELAQSITTDAAAYLKDALSEIGINLISYNEQCISENKYAKKVMDKNPGTQWFVNGKVDFVKPKDINYWEYLALPEGFDIMYFDRDPKKMGIAAGAMSCSDNEEHVALTYNAYISFVNWEEGWTKYNETLSANYDLRLTDPGSGLGLVSLKPATHFFGHSEYNYTYADWVGSEENPSGDVVKVTLNREKYKEAVLALLKKHADNIVAVIKASKG